jgi:hypothetical protein
MFTTAAIELRTLEFIITITGETVQNNKNYCLIDLEKEYLMAVMIPPSTLPLLIVNVTSLRNLNDEKTNDGDDGVVVIIIIAIARMAFALDHNNDQQHLVIVLRKFLQ